MLPRLLPSLRPALRRLLAHGGLALALLLAQLGAVSHFYTAHRLEAQAAEQVVKLKAGHGGQAGEVCELCLAYSIFGGTPPVSYDSIAVTLRANPLGEPHAHGAPFYPFLPYASRAPPLLTA
jgi:hypothetical protein